MLYAPQIFVRNVRPFLSEDNHGCLLPVDNSAWAVDKPDRIVETETAGCGLRLWISG